MTQLSISDRGAVRLITITNPPRGYMNAETAAELLDAIKAAENDDTVRVIVFTGGVPGVFIRHYDVGEIVAVADAARTGAMQPGSDRSASPVYNLFDRLITYAKPTIAAINGVCMGGGCEFALACDIRVAQTGDYHIGLPETRLGIIPGVGGLPLLARVVGLARAQEMVMRGRVVVPQEAAELGMVHDLAPSARDRALEIAVDLAARAPVAVASVKRMAQAVAAGEPLAEGLVRAEHEFFHTLVTGDDAMVKMQDFLTSGEDITKA
jgi:enoyl-CoA hydratase